MTLPLNFFRTGGGGRAGRVRAMGPDHISPQRNEASARWVTKPDGECMRRGFSVLPRGRNTPRRFADAVAASIIADAIPEHSAHAQRLRKHLARPSGGGPALCRDGRSGFFLGAPFSARLFDAVGVAVGSGRTNRDDRSPQRAHYRL